MEDWQKTLNMVIMIEKRPIEVASQEAMGDYSKPRESASNCDLRSCSDVHDGEYIMAWAQTPYQTYACTCEVNT